MEMNEIKKYEGKKVLIILKNNFKYTGYLPILKGSSFKFQDKFGTEVLIDCDYITFLKEVPE
jgi:small nuclear ribonucleoprotein (snRNP)-like protein